MWTTTIKWSVVFFFALAQAQNLTTTPRVRVESGELAGGFVKTINGRQVYSFVGIPYASPPVHKHRFKEPQPVKPWVGVWNATIPGSDCIGLLHKDQISVIGQEDCLYLNVYTPKLPQNGLLNGGLMDVVVYIHGGAFQFGSGSQYGPEYFLDSEDMVLVFINYRLGPFGFASSGDDILPGNNGLKDQVAALKWIQRNIVSFGGNPGSVTIAGMSAGAASVNYHMVSPMSMGLFNKAIGMSGSAHCHWAYSENIVEKTKQLAEFLGCPTYYSKDTIKCLRSRPAVAIAESVKNFMPWRFNPFTVFGPSVEPTGADRFLPDKPENLPIQDVPAIFSVTQEDGLYPAAELITYDEVLVEMETKWSEIAPFLLDYNYTIADETRRQEIAQTVKSFYFGNNTISAATKDQIVQMLSDRMFKEPVVRFSKHLASKNTSPVYFYEFAYRGRDSLSNKYTKSGTSQGLGVAHGDDTMYIIQTKYGRPHEVIEDAKLIPIMVNVWSSFIKTGNPNINNTTSWLPVSKNPADPLKLVKITQNQTFEPMELPNLGNSAFWRSLPLSDFPIAVSPDSVTSHAEL
ncbi:esterase E4-like [Daktulosphaira vitifoliae]|uniref:esterase E4-like n=1 Tax=Daktulosphaira vitifoliae TaxID=58002 RepID=UPI0021A9C795|nr:esterase E4-like [Daktulosphaira vitifoliae]